MSSSEFKPGRQAALPIIDKDRIQLIESMNEVGKSDMVNELIEMFLTNSAEKTKKIDVSMNEHRWKEAALDFHALKSTAAALGAIQLEVLCEQIELFLNAEQFAEAEQAFGDLGELFTSTVESLRQILALRKPEGT